MQYVGKSATGGAVYSVNKFWAVQGRGQFSGKYLQSDAVSWGPLTNVYKFRNQKEAADRAYEVQGTPVEI